MYFLGRIGRKVVWSFVGRAAALCLAVCAEQGLAFEDIRDFLISSDLLNNKEPQIHADERRFRMQYPRLSAFICG
ncbi:MAG: hypothetical protein MIO93_03925 [ANME-2 cluster archaeon]|nr:hypothetical protein [ANME-2 cluster archaeon]